MKNQETLIGIAVGVGLVAAIGFYLFYVNRPLGERLMESVEDFADEAKGQYNDVKQKAKREYKNMKDNGEEFARTATNNAKDWANEPGAGI